MCCVGVCNAANGAMKWIMYIWVCTLNQYKWSKIDFNLILSYYYNLYNWWCNEMNYVYIILPLNLVTITL